MSRWPILAGARRVQVKYDGSITRAGLDEGSVPQWRNEQKIVLRCWCPSALLSWYYYHAIALLCYQLSY